MIPEDGFDVEKFLKHDGVKKRGLDADMKIVLGYLNQSELITGLNIGNIM